MREANEGGGEAGRTLYRFVYCSTMSFDQRDVPFTPEVQAILEWSRQYNPTAEVTGALMVGAGRFAQVLEGPKSAVKALFSNIACDPRHRHLLLLGSEPIAERNFADWSMAYFSEEEQRIVPLSSRPEGSTLGEPSLTASGLVAMMTHMVRRRLLASEILSEA